MELRQCACGGEIAPRVFSDCAHYGESGSYVMCWCCSKKTQMFNTFNEAIQAWNEGEVE